MPGDDSLYAAVRARPPRNAAAGALAVVASALAHVALFLNIPELPVGKPADVEMHRPFRTVELGQIRLRPPVPAKRPAAFRPEDPGRIVESAWSGAEFASASEALQPPPPNGGPEALAGEGKAVAKPASAGPAGTWEPRSEILRIQEQLFSEEISALPRRYEAAVPRADKAPDVVPSVVAPPGTSLEQLAQRLRAPETADVARDGSRRIPGGASIEGAGAGGPSARDEASDLLGEARSAITDLEGLEDLLSLDVRVFRPAGEPDVYFSVRIERRGEGSLPVLPKDVVLIQDCSESMTQRKLDDCKVGLHRWLGTLGEQDRLNVVGFRDRPYRCFDGWRPVNPHTIGQARLFIEGMVSQGRTDVYASLEDLLQTGSSEGRPVLAVLVTDGRPTTGIVDGSEIIEQFSRLNQGRHSVFCLGGGRRVNSFLLDLLSFKNRGDSTLVQERTEIPDAMADMAVQLGRPVLIDLEYRLGGEDEVETYPRTLTHLYLDRPLLILGRAPAVVGAVPLQIIGLSEGKRHDMVFALDLEGAQPGEREIREQWAWQKIYDLIGEHIRTRDDAVVARIQELAGAHGLRVPYGINVPMW